MSKEVQKTLNQYARTILFGSRNPTALNADSKLILDEIANIINQYPNSKFVIEGHTDSIGSYAQNKIISDQRANIVMEYLIEQGVSKDQLTAIGYGERRPIATNMYKHGRRLNRRVEINLIK